MRKLSNQSWMQSECRLHVIEQILELFEVGVPVNFQNFIVIWSQMNRGIHHWHSSSSQVLVPLLRDSTFVADSWRLSQNIDGRRSTYRGLSTSSFQVDCHHLASVSWCSLHLQTHHSAPVSWCTQHGLSSCCHSWECVVVSWLLSRTSFLSLHETELWSNSWFPGLFEAPESFGEVCFAFRRFLHTKLIGLGFATAEPSSVFLSWAFFDMVLCSLFERKMAARKTPRNSWCSTIKEDAPHSSRVKIPLVNMSASWCLVSTYLIWILGSKLILSNNESSATLWVLNTCLIVGLLPLTIILITASLSSKMYNWDSPWKRFCVCGDVVHMWQLINISVFLVFGVWICDPAKSFLLLGE